jgi:ABC-2 type transport system ATP-binding protein
MIEIRDLTKRYGPTLAVDQLSCDIHPGRVTGFLGPNGAGKSTTMRMVLGLDNPDRGNVRINGRPFREHERPMAAVGALLDAKAVHGGRSARDHLRCLAQSNQIPAARVGEVLEAVGLASVAGKRIRGFSLGMSQRLGIAAALLGDPQTLLFDEPVNGLDPEGIRWIRDFMRRLAADGRTVFVSSHLMSEMALTADHLIVIGKGRLIADTGVDEFVARFGTTFVRVRSPEPERFADLLAAEGAGGRSEPDGSLSVWHLPSERIGELAAAHGVVLHELAPQGSSLEDAYLAMTAGSVEYRSTAPASPSPSPPVRGNARPVRGGRLVAERRVDR